MNPFYSSDTWSGRLSCSSVKFIGLLENILPESSGFLATLDSQGSLPLRASARLPVAGILW